VSAAAFAVAGVLAGLSQAELLWRDVARRGRLPGFALRLGLVGGLLLGAGLLGEVVSAAAGWGGGFLAGVALVAWRTAP
jgi:hypothetical protein